MTRCDECVALVKHRTTNRTNYPILFLLFIHYINTIYRSISIYKQ